MFTCRSLKLFLAVLRSAAICFFCLYISFILKCSWSITATTRPKMRKKGNRVGENSSVILLHTCHMWAFSSLHFTLYAGMTHWRKLIVLQYHYFQNCFPFSLWRFLYLLQILFEGRGVGKEGINIFFKSSSEYLNLINIQLQEIRVIISS